jgi:cytoskeletal protein RodZ
MRCKNCGSENDDNLYICQTCGSPLYEEEDLSAGEDSTQVFGAVTDGAGTVPPVKSAEEELRELKEKEAQKKKKQTTALIVILAVVLVAIIIGTVVAVVHAKKGNNETTLSTVSTTLEESTTAGTTEPTTTTTTTETTTTTTTTTTTKAEKYNVSLTCNNGGEVEGDGKYVKGDEVTVIARPDDGYEFDGWYKGSKKVSSSTDYTFTIMENTNLTAYFIIMDGGNADTINGEDDN